MNRRLFLAPALILSAAAQADSGPIEAGEWEMTTHFTTVEVPGMPQVAEDAMREMRPYIRRRCITPAEAANPTGDLLSSASENCRYSQVHFSAGRIRVEGACPLEEGNGEMHLTWEGSYTATTMAGDIRTTTVGANPELRMQGTITARRLGECTD